jgi:hypothetical protein
MHKDADGLDGKTPKKAALNGINMSGKFTEGSLKSKKLAMRESCPMSTTEAKIRASAQLIYRNLDAFQGKISCILHDKDNTPAGIDKLDLGDVLEISQVGAYAGNYLITGIKNDFISGLGWRVTLTLGLPLNYTLFSDWLKAPPVPNLIGQVVAWKKDPEGLERIPVWLPEITDKDTAVVWARLGTPFASKFEGVYFQPNVKDEVLVGFSGGISSYPFIIGSTHNPENKPPIPYVDKIEKRGIFFDPDEKGKGDYKSTFLSWDKKKKLVRLQGGKKASIDLDDKKGLILDFHDGDPISTLSIDKDALKLVHKKDTHLEVKGLIDMKIKEKLTVKADSGVAIEAKVDIKGTTKIS